MSLVIAGDKIFLLISGPTLTAIMYKQSTTLHARTPLTAPPCGNIIFVEESKRITG